MLGKFATEHYRLSSEAITHGRSGLEPGCFSDRVIGLIRYWCGDLKQPAIRLAERPVVSVDDKNLHRVGERRGSQSSLGSRV